LLLHDSQMHRVASGQAPVAKDNLFDPLNHSSANRENFIDNPE
jgi:hypothetical protein